MHHSSIDRAKNGKSNDPTKGQRGHVTGCKRAYGGDREVRPGARGVMAPGVAAVIGCPAVWPA